MRDQDEAIHRVVYQLLPLGPVVARRMFGAAALSLDDRVFGIVHEGTVYFRTDEVTSERYADAGSAAFHMPESDGFEAVMPYHEVPQHVLLNSDLVCAWAYESVTRCTE
jgi:DNA transformation protein